MTRLDKFEQAAGTDAVRANLRSRSVRGATALAFGAGGEILVRLVSIVILSRLIVPEQFGLIAMVMALAAIASVFSQLGLSTATVQRREINHRQVTNLFWINVAIGVVLTTSFCALSPLIAAFYGEPRLVAISLAISMTFLWGGFTVQHEALLIRQMKQTLTASVRLTASVLSAGLAIVLALADFGYWALVSQEVARAALVAAGVWLLCPWRPGLPDRKEDVRSLVRFGAELTLTQLLYGVISNVDRLLIGKLFGAGPLGLYRQAHQLVMVPIEQLNAPISSVAQPGLSMLQNDPERYRRYYERIVFVIGMGTMSFAGFAVVYAEELTVVILGRDWIGAAPYLRIFAAAAFIRPVMGSASAVLITCGKSRKLLAMTVVSQLTLVAFVGVGILGGPEGIAAAYLATAAVLFIPNLWYCFAGSPVTLGGFFRAIRTPLTASSIMIGGLVILRLAVPDQDNLSSLGLGIGVGTALFIAGCLLMPRGREELRALLADVSVSLPTGLLQSWNRHAR